MGGTSAEKPKDKLSCHTFYFETPLYTPINIEDLENDIFDGNVDAYNPLQKFDTTFKIIDKRMGGNYCNYHRVTLVCKRDDDTYLTFFIFEGAKAVVKIGQNPSLADIQFAELGKKYDKLLDKQRLAEFKRALGLAAHGVGAGSLIYLRRIFESLILQAFQENKNKHSLDVKEFSALRMGEKVTALKTFLPSQLVEMKKVYKILSNGIHNLSECECLAYFPTLKLSIELILDQKIEMAAKAKRDAAVKKQIEGMS